jgi:hypothetical protein
VGDEPEGPYAFAEAIVEAFTHEPTAVRTPGGGLICGFTAVRAVLFSGGSS